MSSDTERNSRGIREILSDGPHDNQSEYIVDRHTPSFVARPSSVEDLQEIIRAANSESAAVIPWGGGTQMGFGNIPASYLIAVDLSNLKEVLRYEPDDMTMSVQAGCKLGDLNRMLHEHRQVLPVDAAFPDDATIGGLTAVGASGPRRFGYGPLRDLIIGMTVMLPDGTIATAGGQVVKNVTGYDMMRLHHGSLGSLAIILSLNLKVIPKPQSERSVIATFERIEDAHRAAIEVIESQLGVTAIVLLSPEATSTVDSTIESGWTLVARCEAPPSAVVRQGERVIEYVGEAANDVRVIDETAKSDALWGTVSLAFDQRAESDDVGLRFGVTSSRMATFVRSIESIFENNKPLRMTLDYGSNLAYARHANTSESLKEFPEKFGRCLAIADHASLLTAPTEMKHGIDVFGKTPAGFSYIESLKHTFDPKNTLNPGRYIGKL